MADYTALEDLSHDSNLAQALGNMVVCWAHADIVLFSTFARVTGIGLNMAMASYHRIPTFESRVKFLRALLPDWQTKEFDKNAIDKAIGKLAKLASTRNHWVHGDWCATRDRSETVIFDHRTDPNSAGRRKPVKTADILNHCQAVKIRSAALAALIKWHDLEG